MSPSTPLDQLTDDERRYRVSLATRNEIFYGHGPNVLAAWNMADKLRRTRGKQATCASVEVLDKYLGYREVAS